jgi:hypothetical protein
MLWLERQMVTELVSPTVAQSERDEIEQYVDGALRSMPDHLRLGVAVESVAFGALVRVQRALGADPRAGLAPHIEQWSASRISVVRQYVRLLRSLVLFAEHELAAEPGA